MCSWVSVRMCEGVHIICILNPMHATGQALQCENEGETTRTDLPKEGFPAIGLYYDRCVEEGEFRAKVEMGAAEDIGLISKCAM